MLKVPEGSTLMGRHSQCLTGFLGDGVHDILDKWCVGHIFCTMANLLGSNASPTKGDRLVAFYMPD